MIRKEQLLAPEDKASRTQVPCVANPLALSKDMFLHSVHLVNGEVEH